MTLNSVTQRPVKRRTRRPNRKLQQLRLNEGLSPNALAYRAGVSGNTIRMAEAGFRPEPRNQFSIASVFGLLPLDIWPIEDQL
jgi:lambda repressor-like predicted transcriptional regulator